MRSSEKKIFTIIIFSIILFFTTGQTGRSSQFFTDYFSTYNYSTYNLLNYNYFLFSPFNPSYFNLLWQDLDEAASPKDSSYFDKGLMYDKENLGRYEELRSRFGFYENYIPEGYEYSAEMDSSGERFRTRETFDSINITYPYELSLDEYLELRKNKLTDNIWDSLTADYDLKKSLSGGDIARLLGQATGIAIPVPPNPVINIFGKPEISINVNGEVNLRMGFRWDSQNLGTVSAFGQTQASPMFNQDIRVNVSGRIGDKLKLGTDWNTRRTFDHDNQFKIGYEGEDDDIIKLVEVGNVSLPLESQLIGGGDALFGVRADFQFGPLFLKTLFSQRRGERKFVDVRGGVSRQYFRLHAYDYAKNHFFLDTAYKTIYDSYFENPSSPVIKNDNSEANYMRIKEIEVWETTNDVRDVHSAEAVAFADLEPIKSKQGETYSNSKKSEPMEAGKIESGRFMRLDSNRYRVNRNLGTLTILNLRQDRTYAVAFRTEGKDANTPNDDEYYGTFSQHAKTKDTLILRLVYRPNLQPKFETLWDRQMKNIYSINATNVNRDETEIGVWYINQSNDSTDVLQGAPDKLLKILGVDNVTNSTGSKPPDGKFDLKEPFFNAQYGEITFPDTRPFDSGLVEYFEEQGNAQLAQQYTFPEVYDTTYDIARLNANRDRFIISGYVSGRATNKISLGAFNLAQGSVKITLDGKQLREYEDYIVDYYAGTVTLRNPRATLPNADLQIQYEQHDVFNISTRTLAGIRGDYIVERNRRMEAMLGFTVMHYDQSALIDRVRIGEEPVSNTMLGLDGSLQWDTPWMTKMLDMLPFYDTKAKSHLNVGGELAMILPTPNKRESNVSSDNGEPVVYIDDFEGAQRQISLGLNPTQWSHSSPPVDSSIALDDTSRAKYRGKMFWFQYFIPRVPIKDIWPNRSTLTGRSKVSPLEILFDPNFRGIYNNNPEYLDPRNPDYDSTDAFAFKPENREKIWGGMMRLFSSFNTNFDTENIEYIEIMMRVNPNLYEPGRTKMYIELGQISEDVIPNDTLDTEDGSTAANPLPNGIIDVGEDKGLDRLNNDQEREVYLPPLNKEDDPARDDYSFNFNEDDQYRDDNDFRFYNNYEGNARVSELGQFPDTEILNDNNGQTLARDNSYFTYEVNLTPDPNVNKQIVGGNEDKGWFLYRIPIRKPDRRTGNPSFSNIQYIRAWFKGGVLKAKIADWRLVGSQWQRISQFQSDVPPDDSVMSLAFVNREENAGPPDFYTLPPGVHPPRQRGAARQYEDIQLNEQSLSVSVKNLRYGDERMAVRIFRDMDLFNYNELKFFIHGDGSMPDKIVPGSTPKAYAFVRFGTDSSNYYEYRVPLVRGWQDLGIKMDELTAIKKIRDTSRIFERQDGFPVPGEEFSTFAIKGNPILTRVKFFGVGISNPEERFPNELTTTMWVNELRLISPEDDADWAGIGNIDMKLADLGSISANFRHSLPNFHKLEERFGNRMTTTQWSVSMQGNLEKFAPKSFKGMKLPISYTHSEFFENPEYVANSDINLDEAADAVYDDVYNNSQNRGEAKNAAQEFREESQTLRIQDRWAITGVQLGLPTKFWMIDKTLNRITFTYSYSQEYERSPVVEERFSWIWQLNAKYSVNFPNLLEFEPMGWAKEVPILNTYNELKVNFLPNNLSLGLDMQRQRTTEKSRFLDFPSPVYRDFSASRNAQFTWKFAEGGFINPVLDYSVNSQNTLVPLEFNAQGEQRTGSEIASAMFFNDGSIIDFGKNNRHTQTVTLKFTPVLPNAAGISEAMDISGQFNTTYNWDNPREPDPELTDVAKNASYNSSIRFSLGLKLKSLGDSWFGGGTSSGQGSPTGFAPPDTSRDKKPKSKSGGLKLLGTVGKVFKTIFMDYEKVDFSINQQNSSTNPGVYGGTGMNNFWGRSLLFRDNRDIYGPSTAYQLGLVSNPHGGFYMTGSDKFPWFGFNTYTGLRPPNAVLQDNYSQSTSFKIATNRPLWKDATLELNWQTSLGYNRNSTVITEDDGVPQFTNIIAMESLQRTYLALPTIFGINLGNTIESVVELYELKKAAIEAAAVDSIDKYQKLQNALGQSFHDGFELFSIFSGQAGKFMPAVNWALRWEGIEDWGIWGGIAKRVSLEHAYQSQYQENAQITDNGRTVQGQQVQFGFQPLVGLTMGFDENALNGVLTASFRWNSQTSYQLMSSNRSTITRQSSEEISVQASYTMKSFDFPLLGFTFKNDFEVSWMTSFKMNKRATYDILDESSYEDNEEGRTLDGNTQLTIEPRATYSISDRVRASFFFRYEGTFTEGAAQPGFSTYQVGLDIRISIAGGR